MFILSNPTIHRPRIQVKAGVQQSGMSKFLGTTQQKARETRLQAVGLYDI